MILSKIVSSFVASARKDSFNGLPVTGLLDICKDTTELKTILQQLILNEKINCAFASDSVNPHIKRLPDLSKEKQIEFLQTEELTGVCAYPCRSEILKCVDITELNDRPFSRDLFLAEPQLSFRSFEMGVLERYRNDPRYSIQYDDYMGHMSISGDYYHDAKFPDRDKIGIQTFGLGFDGAIIPYIVVFLRYLSNLSPEHQQYWNSYRVDSDVKMCKQYYQSSILGQFWDNRSIRYAIQMEMQILNDMFKEIYGIVIFRDIPDGDVPIDLTSFLRPTNENYQRFILALDKLLSGNINEKFFNGKVALEVEKCRPDGKIEVQRKGSIQLLAEWLCGAINWNDPEQFNEIIIMPLRNVRKLRQTPAHKFTKDDFSTEYYSERRKILWSIFNSLSNIRQMFGRHPKVAKIEVPSWLDEESIDVF